ncbi:DUF2345 domain-containing protein, partial [Burkholderia multivorans]|uniref:DUF2345 domain-containing protein n=4 Tax=Burkholderia multivorans TaxID=87883 RepID=UPI001C23BBFA
ASIGQKLSLFVQNAGMKLFAGKGKVEIQAQSDNVEVTAQKTVKVVSATDRIEIAADQGILLTSGGGYIRIQGGNIEIHTPGAVDVKGASHTFAGPASMGYPLPSPRPDQPGQLELFHKYANGEAVKGGLFTVKDVNGAVLKKGALDNSGYTVVSGLPPGAVRVEFGKDPRESDQPANYFKEAKWPAEPVAPSPEAAQAAATGQLASQLKGMEPAAATAAVELASGGGAGAALGGLASSALPAAAAALGGAGAVSALQTASSLGSAAKQVAGMVQAARQGGLAALAAPAANAASGALQGALPGVAGIAGKGATAMASAGGAAGMKLPTSGFGGPLKS